MARRRNIGATDLGLDPDSGREPQLFRWFLASFLFGKRITQELASRTFEVFMKAGINTPAKITQTGWRGLVDKLDEGGYTRYDYSTASMLLEDMEKLRQEYGGKIANIFKQSKDISDLRRRLEEFKGVGPKTVEIFLREIDHPMQIAGRKKAA